MSILITGMEIPTAEQGLRTINIYADGVVTNYAEEIIGKAIPVPPHGRLGDLDALAQLFKEKAAEHGGIGGIMVAMAAGCIDAAPTIILAEEAIQKEGGQDDV